MFIYQGRKVNIDQPVEYEGVRYPNLRSEETRTLLGVQELPDPIRPNPLTHSFAENFDGSLTIAEKPAQQVIDVLWNQIKAQRDSVTENGGCQHAGYWFHTDVKSKQQQMALLMLGANIPGGLMWKTMDGTLAMMTQALAASLFAAQVAREQAIFAQAETMKASLANMTMAEFEAFDANSGWPAQYQNQ